jgi:uncharacterized protein (UPF0335 family)
MTAFSGLHRIPAVYRRCMKHPRHRRPACASGLSEGAGSSIPPPSIESGAGNPMSDGNVAADQLRLFIERIERLEEEKKGMQDDIKDVYLEAKSQGYDPKTMRTIVRLRKMEKNARDEAEALLETYKAALGLS